VNFRQADTELFAKDQKINLPQSGFYLLEKVFVTDLGIIYKNFSPLKENIVCYDIDFKNYRLRYLFKSYLQFRRFAYKGRQCIIIFDNYSGPNGFAHWICDGLTRLMEVNDILDRYTVIVPAYFKEEAIYRDSMALFDIKDIHYLPKNSFTYFKALHFPSPVGDTGNFHPENVKKLRALVTNKIPVVAGPARNIYISRQKAKRRFIQNETEVGGLLAKYNFETIYLEDYSFTQQINLIANAANIISIHGAALAMLLFAQTGASVMELRGQKDAVNNMYYLLASVCGLHYYYLNCESILHSATGNNFDL
ncbi:MAG TPA: glycosyltransferase family 61 protein, partial [Bacteroidia bacterium]|nr:glycosyltransferase family 61 protein [Bacteroidia bacterium]